MWPCKDSYVLIFWFQWWYSCLRWQNSETMRATSLGTLGTHKAEECLEASVLTSELNNLRIILASVTVFSEILICLPDSWSYFPNIRDFVNLLTFLRCCLYCDQNVVADHKRGNKHYPRKKTWGEMDFVVTGYDFTISSTFCFKYSAQSGNRSRKWTFHWSQMKINLDEFRNLLACYWSVFVPSQ